MVLTKAYKSSWIFELPDLLKRPPASPESRFLLGKGGDSDCSPFRLFVHQIKERPDGALSAGKGHQTNTRAGLHPTCDCELSLRNVVVSIGVLPGEKRLGGAWRVSC
jgi:hypothetical protein